MNYFSETTLVLASGSPRRRELIQKLGFPYRFLDQDCDESFPIKLTPIEIPEFLANKKFDQINVDYLPSELLITADTLVEINGKVFEKPTDLEDAKRMILALSGQTHFVHSGVCLGNELTKLSFTQTTKVTFKVLSKQEIDFYVEMFKPLDKSGAYGIQEWIGYIGVTHIDGCFYNVMGLPLNTLFEKIKSFNEC